jgi:hypothetical protein
MLVDWSSSRGFITIASEHCFQILRDQQSFDAIIIADWWGTDGPSSLTTSNVGAGAPSLVRLPLGGNVGDRRCSRGFITIGTQHCFQILSDQQSFDAIILADWWGTDGPSSLTTSNVGAGAPSLVRLSRGGNEGDRRSSRGFITIASQHCFQILRDQQSFDASRQ